MSPTGNLFWDFILAVLGLATALGLLVGAAKGLPRVNRDTEKVKESPLPPTWTEMWEEMRKQREEIDELRRSDVDNTAHIGELQRDVQDLRANEGRLVAWVVTLHSGIRDGTIPPLPDIPDWLDKLLHRDNT